MTLAQDEQGQFFTPAHQSTKATIRLELRFSTRRWGSVSDTLIGNLTTFMGMGSAGITVSHSRWHLSGKRLVAAPYTSYVRCRRQRFILRRLV